MKSRTYSITLALLFALTARANVLRRVRGPNHTVLTIAFDHATGKTSRIVADEASGKVLREESLPGRPQSNRQERDQAISIIADDPTLQFLLFNGAQTEGGFIVDGPSDHPPDHRYIQIRLLSADRRTLLRVVIVDLSAAAVASVRESFE